MVTLAAGEDGDAQGEHQGAGRQPSPLAQVELVALRIVVKGELGRQRGDIGILLHADLLGQHFGLVGQLAQLGVVVQGCLGPFVDLIEHMLGIVFQLALDVDGTVQVDAHHGLQLPQGQVDGIFGVVHVGNGGGQGTLGPDHLQLRSLAGLVPAFGVLVVLDGVLIHGVVHVVGSLGHEHGIVGLLHGSHGAQTGFAGLLHSLLNLVPGDAQAFPQLEIHDGHAGAQSQGHLVAAAHLDGTVPGGGIVGFHGLHIRDERRSRHLVQLLDVVHDGFQHGGVHTCHSTAGRRRTTVIGIRAEIYFLFDNSVIVGPGSIDLREQLAVGTLLRILRALDFHIGHFHGGVFRKGDLEGVVQAEHQGGIPGRTLFPAELRPRRRRNQQCERQKNFLYSHITN